MKPNHLTPLRQHAKFRCAPTKLGARQPGSLTALLATFLWLALSAHPAFAAIIESQELRCEPAPQGLVAWWPGDGNANDIVGANHGMLRNGAAFAPGMVGQAFRLGGTNDFVEMSNTPSLSLTGAITIAAWIKPAQVASGTIASKYDSSLSQLSWAFLIVDGGKLRFTLHGDGSYRYVDSTDSVVVPGVFSHVAGTFDPVTQAIKLYVN